MAKYVIPERVCVARWATGNSDHEAGDLCGRPASCTVADVDLCTHHYKRLRDWRCWELPVREADERTKAIRAADERYRQALYDSEIGREQARTEISLVYFIRRTSDGMIKIGTTTAFGRRMSTIRGQHGALQILLTHGGARAEEQKLHKQFDAYRIGSTEWFRPTRTLLQWIYAQRMCFRYHETQQPGAVTVKALRKLAGAAPRDKDLQMKRGRVVWPEQAA